jgi:hypothetical protein
MQSLLQLPPPQQIDAPGRRPTLSDSLVTLSFQQPKVVGQAHDAVVAAGGAALCSGAHACERAVAPRRSGPARSGSKQRPSLGMATHTQWQRRLPLACLWRVAGETNGAIPGSRARPVGLGARSRVVQPYAPAGWEPPIWS